MSGLETDTQKKEDGGATGSWRMIWPIIRIACLVTRFNTLLGFAACRSASFNFNIIYDYGHLTKKVFV